MTSLRSCIIINCSEQQNFVKNRVETAWIMAEIEPYSFESMRNSSESEEDDVHEGQDERRRGNEINCVVYASVIRSRTEKGNKRKNVYAPRRIEEAVNKI